jgi:uncharacterized protein
MQTASIDLRAKDQQYLRSLLAQYLPGVHAWAYGSRVKGTSHACSDLDIVLRSSDGSELPLAQLSNFRQAVSDSNIPIIVDCRDWARLPKHFQQEIDRFHAVLA